MAGHAIETKEECWRSLVSESALHVKDTINGWNERMPPYSGTASVRSTPNSADPALTS